MFGCMDQNEVFAPALNKSSAFLSSCIHSPRSWQVPNSVFNVQAMRAERAHHTDVQKGGIKGKSIVCLQLEDEMVCGSNGRE